MVGREAALVIAVLCVAGTADAGPVTRAGVTWSARPAIVRKDKTATLRWTMTARGIDQRARRVPCVQFTIVEESGELVNGKFSDAGGGHGLRAEPANGCAPSAKTTVTAKAAWRYQVPARDHAAIGAGEAMRARIEIRIGDDTVIELATVILAVGDDGVARITTVATRKR